MGNERTNERANEMTSDYSKVSRESCVLCDGDSKSSEQQDIKIQNSITKVRFTYETG